jgi:uncharacterized membrane protein YjjP (DUF1212 family)
MDYNQLLDLAVDLGYELSMAGAETFRVEDSISRVLKTYGLEPEVYAIPNCIHVSVTMPDGESLSEMRRVGFHGNDLDAVETFSGLSRRICTQKPDTDTARQWLNDACASQRQYSNLLQLFGYMIASFAFGIFFGGNLLDAVCGGIGGLAVGLCVMFMDKFQANNFFKTMLASIPLALIPYAFGALGICQRPDMATIGTVMVLVPGLLFTYAMRDIIYGDTNSGVNRIVQVLLIAVAIACGTAVAWNFAEAVWGEPQSLPAIDHSFLVECIAGAIGCLGFSFLFNVHGKGIVLCMLGGVICWGAYCLTMFLGGSENMATLIASFVTAIYSEVMARVRKCPAIGYLVLGLIPLIPGSSLYYTMNYAVRGNMEMFSLRGMKTIELAGLMAAGILLVSTSMRMWLVWKQQRKKK